MQAGTVKAISGPEVMPPPTPPTWRQRTLGFVISVVIALCGLGILAGGRILLDAGSADLTPLAVWWTAAALVMWGLAELLSRRPALHPADIVLAVLFAAFSGLAIYAWLLVSGFSDKAAPLTASGTLLAFLVHYYRFRLPFTVLPIAVAGWLMTVGLITIVAHLAAGWQPEREGSLVPAVSLLYGAGLFFYACRLDGCSRAETGTKSANAFWLHLLAGPLLAIPVMLAVSGSGTADVSSTAHSASVALLVLAFAYISLLVDRAALVAGGVLFLLAIPAISHVQAEQVPWAGLMAAGFGIEAAAVALGVFWHPLRRTALGLLPTPWAKWFAAPISDSR